MGQRTVLLVNLSSFRVHEELHTRCEVRDKEKTEQAIRIKRKEESADVGPLNSSLEANGPLFFSLFMGDERPLLYILMRTQGPYKQAEQRAVRVPASTYGPGIRSVRNVIGRNIPPARRR